MPFCKFCKKWVDKGIGKRPKEFCNNTCRSNHWYALNKKGKVIEAAPSQKAYDAPKLPDNFTLDEPLSFERLKQQIVPKPVEQYYQVPVQVVMKRYWDEKRELTADDYPDWLSRLYADTRLNKKQQDLIKNTNQNE